MKPSDVTKNQASLGGLHLGLIFGFQEGKTSVTPTPTVVDDASPDGAAFPISRISLLVFETEVERHRDPHQADRLERQGEPIAMKGQHAVEPHDDTAPSSQKQNWLPGQYKNDGPGEFSFDVHGKFIRF